MEASFADGTRLSDGYYDASARPLRRRGRAECTICPIGSAEWRCQARDMAERPHPELDTGRAGSAMAPAEGDPANELYDYAVSLLERRVGEPVERD